MLPADDTTGQNYKIIHDFCANLSLCSRGHSFVSDDKWRRVFCFAERADAKKLEERFGGEWFDPERRGRGCPKHPGTVAVGGDARTRHMVAIG